MGSLDFLENRRWYVLTPTIPFVEYPYKCDILPKQLRDLQSHFQWIGKQLILGTYFVLTGGWQRWKVKTYETRVVPKIHSLYIVHLRRCLPPNVNEREHSASHFPRPIVVRMMEESDSSL